LQYGPILNYAFWGAVICDSKDSFEPKLSILVLICDMPNIRAFSPVINEKNIFKGFYKTMSY